MSFNEKIRKQEQRIARLEQSLAQQKLKARKQETRRKIELGGLVVKAGLDGYNKAIILGALISAVRSLEDEPGTDALYQAKGEKAFLDG